MKILFLGVTRTVLCFQKLFWLFLMILNSLVLILIVLKSPHCLIFILEVFIFPQACILKSSMDYGLGESFLCYLWCHHPSHFGLKAFLFLLMSFISLSFLKGTNNIGEFSPYLWFHPLWSLVFELNGFLFFLMMSHALDHSSLLSWNFYFFLC